MYEETALHIRIFSSSFRTGRKMGCDHDELDFESLPSNYSTAIHLLAGGLAGISEHALMYPLDSIKTRMQIISANGSASVHSSVFQTVYKVGATEGLRSLWRGVSSVILGAGPSHALYFAVYEECKTAFGGNGEGHHPLSTGTFLSQLLTFTLFTFCLSSSGCDSDRLQ
jgi:hypothetical protein